MYKLNAWYDRQEETKRFLLFIGLMALAIIPIHVGMNLQLYPLSAFGALVLSFMACWAMIRSFGMSLIARIMAMVVLGITLTMTVAIILVNLFA